MQNDWHSHIAQLPANTREVDGNAMSSNYISNNAFNSIIKYFVDGKKESTEIENENKCKKEKCNKSSKKSGQKRLYGGPTEETFFVLLHTLKAFADQITYLLSIKKIKYILAGRINNDSIELRLSLNRYYICVFYFPSNS